MIRDFTRNKNLTDLTGQICLEEKVQTNVALIPAQEVTATTTTHAENTMNSQEEICCTRSVEYGMYARMY